MDNTRGEGANPLSTTQSPLQPDSQDYENTLCPKCLQILKIFPPREGYQMSTAAELSSPANIWMTTSIFFSSSGNIAKFMRKTKPATAKLPGPKAPFS